MIPGGAAGTEQRLTQDWAVLRTGVGMSMPDMADTEEVMIPGSTGTEPELPNTNEEAEVEDWLSDWSCGGLTGAGTCPACPGSRSHLSAAAALLPHLDSWCFLNWFFVCLQYEHS